MSVFGLLPSPARPADELEPGGDVAPLVGAAHLELDILRPEQVGEVVCLEQHVAELRERQPAREPDLDRLLVEHVRDREMLARVAQEIDERQLPQPIEVVDERRAIRLRREVEEPLELASDPDDVPLQRLAVEQVAFRRPPRRIPDHPGPAADDRDRPPAEALEPQQPEDGDQMADMERIGRRVESDVAGDRPSGREARGQARCRLMQDAAPLEFRQQSVQTRPWRARHRSGRRAVSTFREAPNRSFTPPMLSCGH